MTDAVQIDIEPTDTSAAPGTEAKQLVTAPTTGSLQPWQREPTAIDLVREAISQGASLDVIREVKALAQEMDQWAARKAFDRAMAAAKAAIPTIAKNRTVDFTSQKGRTHYRHEDLAEIARTIDPILGAQGLSYRFRTSADPNQPVTVTCIVSHKDGYFEENTLSAGRDDSGNKNGIQAIGSTITYLQRYTLKAALGLAASNDDDGKMADAPVATAITSEQAKEIADKIAATSADEAMFLEYFDVEAVIDLPARRFDEAVRMLNMKKARQS